MTQQDNAAGCLQSLVTDFIAQERLPDSFQTLAEQWYLPLLEELKADIEQQKLAVLGITGTQGSGKSTLASFLHRALSECFGFKVAALSLDDFYLGHAARQALGEHIHPLLQTRGVPGTHEVALAMRTIEHLLNHETEVRIPRFDKASDDRKPEAQWDSLQAPVDLVILEGWCVQAPAQDDAELLEPLNELEQQEDPGGTWRHYVNQQNREVYPALYAYLDKLIMLQAPSFAMVEVWRGRQEDKLRAAQAAGTAAAGSKIMDAAQLRRFIQHYERLTLQSLKYLPEQADIVFSLNEAQQITGRRDNPAR